MQAPPGLSSLLRWGWTMTSDLPSRDKHGTYTDLEVRDVLLAWRKGRLVDRDTIDHMEKMWVCVFNSPNDLCESGKMTKKHQKPCGEFWLLPVDAAVGDTDE